MFFTKNLSEGKETTKEKATMWELRAQETGVLDFFSPNGTTTSFTYSDDNLSEIPSGTYYTTIVHFADGTVLMSEVKQK